MGNVADNTLLMRAIGTIGGSQTWSVGLKATVGLTAGSWSVQNLSTVTAALEPMWNTWALTMNSVVRPSIAYNGIKTYFVPAGQSRATLQAQTTRAALAGSQAVSGSPDYTAMVITLQTAFVGRTARGRIYVPCNVPVPPADGQFPQTTLDNYKTGLRTLINAINAYTNAGAGLNSLTVVVSSSSSLKVAPANQPVIALRADSRPDMQERRINKQLPLRVSVGSIP